MKKYVEKVDRWKTLKVLSCLGNFLKNHKGIVNDNDLFLPITDFMEDFDWQKQIKDIYPAATIKRMEKNACSCRLDFDDSPNEILRCVWNAKFARERLRLFLTNEIKRILQDMPLIRFSHEIFPCKLIEMQQTFAISDFEVDVLAVFSFICNNMLTVVDNHNRRSDANDRAVFVAKCLDCDVSEVMAVLDCKSKLRRYNCIDSDFEFNRQLFEFLNGITDEPLSSNYFKLCKEKTLPLEFFGNLAERHGSLIKDILQNNNAGASNILLYAR